MLFLFASAAVAQLCVLESEQAKSSPDAGYCLKERMDDSQADVNVHEPHDDLEEVEATGSAASADTRGHQFGPPLWNRKKHECGTI